MQKLRTGSYDLFWESWVRETEPARPGFHTGEPIQPKMHALFSLTWMHNILFMLFISFDLE